MIMGPLLLVVAMDACAKCHPAMVQAHAGTLMAQTLAPAAALLDTPPMEVSIGPYRYTIHEGRYRVSDGRDGIDAPIHWAIGQGDAGQTYVFEHGGKLYESRVSYYKDPGALAPTIGAPSGVPKSLAEAAGRELSAGAVAECFGCHAAPGPASASVARGTLEWTRTLIPGVQCVNCHRGGETHAAKLTPMPKLVELSAEEQSDLCGACHRTWADIAANGPRGVANVRFQPYRIARSKCYDAADRRIACTACHDPHTRASQTTAKFDAACKNCHASGCTTAATEDCASCHMPKVELPGAHFQFADHWIRIVRSKDEYPD
jgi:hypothetical protein